MSIPDSARLERAIAGALRLARDPAFSIEHLSWFAQLTTVWASGYLEASCREAVELHTAARATPGARNYVGHQLKRFRNPRTRDMLALVKSFDGAAAEELEKFADGKIRASMDSIVTNRHAIAHGRRSQVTLHRVRGYFEDARRFTRKMRLLLGAPGNAEANGTTPATTASPRPPKR